MKRLIITVLALTLTIPLIAQEADPVPDAKTLQEQRDNLIKSGAAKDAEIQKLKLALQNTPENIAKALDTVIQDYEKIKAMPVVQACKKAKGKALITRNEKNQLTFTGCLL